MMCGVRILLWHGYLLGGTGSNVYTRQLAREWSRAGHDITVLSQEPQPEAYDLGGSATVRPDVGGFLPVFVLDRNVEGLIQSYELAFRMQMEAPEVFDLTKESKQTLDLYGIGAKETDNFGRKCLMARRLAEAGVRYIQVTDNGWDHHTKIGELLRKSARGIDKPVTGFLTDMKARGVPRTINRLPEQRATAQGAITIHIAGQCG